MKNKALGDDSLKKSLGVLGGMGSLATADFLHKVIEYTYVEHESDHLHIYADIYPQIPDRVDALLHGGPSPAPAMIEALKKLESCGAEIVVMPCITAHNFHDELFEVAAVPFPNFPEIVAKACEKNYGNKTAAVLSTEATLKMRTILDKLDGEGVPYITPDKEEQDIITGLIYAVKTNKDMGAVVEKFQIILNQMKARGAEYFVLGCTELPVIGDVCASDYEFLNVTSELAKAAIELCGGKLK